MVAENLAPPHRVSIPGLSSPQPVAIPTDLSRPTNLDYSEIFCLYLAENILCLNYKDHSVSVVLDHMQYIHTYIH